MEHQMERPSACVACGRMRARNREKYASRVVETWCHACGYRAFLELKPPYQRAVFYLQMLHGQSMVHESGAHNEAGGWGYLWRLDDVLSLAFPREYANDPNVPYWPFPPWEDRKLALGRPVCLIDPKSDLEYIPGESGPSRRDKLFREINSSPRSRSVLEREVGRVWDEQELRREFVLGGHIPPFVLVQRRSDGMTGSVIYQEVPRYYWDFQPTGKRLV